jgi:signal transduction histidine kinase/CheY-like chemotaxis protein
VSPRGGAPLGLGNPARLLKTVAVVLIVIAAALAYASGVLRPVDDGLAQLRFRLLERPASNTLTVVEIDPASLRAAGTWPWGRERFARAIDNLTAAGAEVVAFDVDFSARSSEASDQALADAIRRRPGQVVLPTFVQARGSRGESLQASLNPLARFTGDAVLASVNVPVDSDGRVRRYRHAFDATEGDRPSMAAVLAGSPPGPAHAFLIDYGIRHGDIDRLSFEAVHAGRFDRDLVRGRKILIGATALELGDEFATPERGTLPGVYVHALAYESLRAGRALRELQTPVLIILAAFAALALFPREGMALGRSLRRHAAVAVATLTVPVAVQASLPVSIDASPVLIVQALCLVWVVRAELRRRARAVIEAREAHLVQLAEHMRESRDRIQAANTQLEAANAALDKALRARTEFLATTSHEIRTPLNGILGMTQVILADRNLPGGLREKVEVVHMSGETMLDLVDDLLDAAKIETGNLVIARADMDLRKLIQDALRLWTDKAAAKGLTLQADLEDVPETIHEDSTRLRQIVSNLLSNAIKFTDEGQVTFLARVAPGADGEVLMLQVSDTGIGIPAGKFDEIFEPFRQVDGSTTRKYGGTGLGLAISRQFAIAMGGELSVESRMGEGSTFTLRLPLRRVEAQPGVSETAEPAAKALSGAVVLLVEANPLAQSVLKAALAGHVDRLDVAVSTGDAEATLRDRPFDLILVEGKTLAEAEEAAPAAVEALKREAQGARVVVLWGGASEAVHRLREAGADHVASKPITADRLVKDLGLLLTASHEVGQSSAAA